MTKTVTIRDVTAAMKLLPTTPAWWLNAELDSAIWAGVASGWLRRPSTTQVEWTAAGAHAFDSDALADRSMTKVEYLELRGLLRANGRYALRWMPTHQAVLMRSLLDAAPDEFEDRVRMSVLLTTARVKPTASMFRAWLIPSLTPSRLLSKKTVATGKETVA